MVTAAGARGSEDQPFIDLTALVPSWEAYESLLKNCNGIQTLIANVGVAQMEVMENGTIPEDVLDWLNPCKCWTETSVSSSKETLVAALEKDKTQLWKRYRGVKKEEVRKANSRRDIMAIPSKETLDRLHRYETANVRQRNRDEASLHKMQTLSKVNAASAGDDDYTEILPEAASCETKKNQGTGVQEQGSAGSVFPLSNDAVGG